MNVLIVDDHPMMLEYLSGAVARAFDGASVHTASDLEAGLQSVRERPFHLALLDLGLPGCGGIESLLRFRKQFPDIRVVIVSAVEDQAAIRGALAAGAAGYIPKTANPKVVVNALRLIAEGGTYVPPQALADEIGRTPDSALTDRQREVMRPVAARQDNRTNCARPRHRRSHRQAPRACGLRRIWRFFPRGLYPYRQSPRRRRPMIQTV